MAWIP